MKAKIKIVLLSICFLFSAALMLSVNVFAAQNQNVSSSIKINYDVPCILVAGSDFNSANNGSMKSNAKSIVFDYFRDSSGNQTSANTYYVYGVNLLNGATYVADVSTSGNGISLYKDSSNNYYVLSHSKISANQNCKDMFKSYYSLNSVTFNNFDTSNTTDMSYMFANTGIISLDLSSFNTSNVINMSYMFYYSNNLVDLVVSSFNTNNVTNMKDMFADLSITSLDLSSFDTSSVTDMNSMFFYCSNLKTVYVDSNKWKTNNVSDSTLMLFQCTSLVGSNGTIYNSTYTNKNYARIDGGPSSSTPGYLSEKRYLLNTWKEICYNSGSGVNFANITEIITTNEIPSNYTASYNVGSTNPDASSATSGCITAYVKGTKIYLYNLKGIFAPTNSFGLFGIKNVSNYLGGGSYSTNTKLSGITTINLDNFILSNNVTNMSYMFYRCTGLINLKLLNFNVSETTNMSYMFYYCSNLVNLDLCKFNISKVTNTNYMFSYCSKLETIYINSQLWKTNTVTNSTSMFYNCSKLVGANGTTYTSTNVNKTYARVDKSGTPGYLSEKYYLLNTWKEICYNSGNGVNFANITEIITTNEIPTSPTASYNVGSPSPTASSATSGCVTAYVKGTNIYLYNIKPIFAPTNSGTLFGGGTNIGGTDKLSNVTTINLSNFKVENNVNYMGFMFYSCKKLTSIDVSNFDTSNVTNMYYMFDNCQSLTSLDLSNFKTSKVTNMYSMFDHCSNLTSLDISNFDTSKVTTMRWMFNYCEKITTLDLSSFNTSKVTDMTQMFNSAYKVTTIYVSNLWTIQTLTDQTQDVFGSNSYLVGGNGTRFSYGNDDASYAVIDTATTPGYFTLKTS